MEIGFLFLSESFEMSWSEVLEISAKFNLDSFAKVFESFANDTLAYLLVNR